MTCYSSLSLKAHIIIADPNLKHCLVEKNQNSIFINIVLNDKILTIGSFYSPPSRDLINDLPLWPQNHTNGSDLLLLSDFNAHSTLWGYNRDDARGLLLLDFITLHNLIILNDPQFLPTYERQNGTQSGRPDLSLCSRSLFTRILNWAVSREVYFADHRHIKINLNFHIPPIPRRRFSTNNVPKSKFITQMKQDIQTKHINFSDLSTPGAFDEMYQKLLDSVQTNCTKYFKLKCSTLKPRLLWWTPELRSHRNRVKALYRKTKLVTSTQDDLIKYKRERAIFKRATNRARKLAWENFCKTATNPYGNIKKVAFEERMDTRIDFIPTGLPGNQLTRTQSLWHLTESLFGNSTLTLQNYQSPPPSLSEKHFTYREIKNAVFSFNPKKAPGPDNIDHNILRVLFKNFPELFMNLYNNLLELNYFPDAWKIGELVYFKKEGKPAALATSYRPITLLPVLGKVFEKLILKRINHHLYHANTLSGKQHGFRELRSTESALLSAISLVELQKSNSNYTSLISLDFQGAFDNLNWGHSIQSLHQLGISQQFINIIRSFLFNRRAQVNWLSPEQLFYFEKGCPQGSCLGPFLWSAFLETLLKSFSMDGCALVAYADDLLLIAWGHTRALLEQRGNSALNYIQDWANNIHIKISQAKSVALTFGKPTKLKRPPIFRLKEGNIRSVSHFQYLGVIIDNTLSFQPHIRNKRIEIYKSTQNLYKFTSTSGRLPNFFFKIWYKTILQRRLAYACGVWYSRMSPSHGNRHILSIQRGIMLLLSRAYKNVSTDALQVLTGLAPLDIQMSLEAEYSAAIRHGVSTANVFAPLYHYKISKHVLDPTWNGIHLCKIEDYKGLIQIYTDGSKSDEGTGSAFCVLRANTEIHSWSARLSSENSVFQAELFAILNAIIWFGSSGEDQSLICTDSLSSLHALQNTENTDPLINDIQQLLQRLNSTPSFLWVRGHSGVLGNERADELAKQAALDYSLPLTFLPFPPSHLKRSQKIALLEKWQLRWDYSEKGRYTYKFFPKVSFLTLIHNRYLYHFLTNHGPFQSHLFRINSSSSPNCYCGKLATSLHYILECELTKDFHIKKHRNQSLADWFQDVLDRPALVNRIAQCVRMLENNRQLFQDPLAPPFIPVPRSNIPLFDSDSD